jgi:hypothetical protein
MHGDYDRGMINSFTNPVAGPTPFLCPRDILEPDKILRVPLQKLSQPGYCTDFPKLIPWDFAK